MQALGTGAWRDGSSPHRWRWRLRWALLRFFWGPGMLRPADQPSNDSRTCCLAGKLVSIWFYHQFRRKRTASSNAAGCCHCTYDTRRPTWQGTDTRAPGCRASRPYLTSSSVGHTICRRSAGLCCSDAFVLGPAPEPLPDIVLPVLQLLLPAVQLMQWAMDSCCLGVRVSHCIVNHYGSRWIALETSQLPSLESVPDHKLCAKSESHASDRLPESESMSTNMKGTQQIRTIHRAAAVPQKHTQVVMHVVVSESGNRSPYPPMELHCATSRPSWKMSGIVCCCSKVLTAIWPYLWRSRPA